jgi:hypothetical protein
VNYATAAAAVRVTVAACAVGGVIDARVVVGAAAAAVGVGWVSVTPQIANKKKKQLAASS